MLSFDAQTAGRLVAALVIGGVLGLNRELHGKPAGFRTHALVCLGAAAATLAALHSGTKGLIDPNAVSRVVQGVLTGIGFIGAGVILRDTSGHVTGLTTAATVWVCAALGFVAALGAWQVLIVTFVLTVLALVLGRALERTTERIFRRRPAQEKAND